MPDPQRTASLHANYEPHPDPVALTSPQHSSATPSNPSDPTNKSASPKNVSNVDYTPYPEKSLKVSDTRQRIVKAVCSLYSGSKSEEDILVYARESIYDDPWSYCDTRFKTAGQWWGIPLAFHTSRTLATQIVASTPTTLSFKLQQEWTFKLIHTSYVHTSLVTLTLDPDPDGKTGPDAWKETVRYHKDMWNEKDYSHEGIGKVMKTLNGDYLTGVTRPPSWL